MLVLLGPRQSSENTGLRKQPERILERQLGNYNQKNAKGKGGIGRVLTTSVTQLNVCEITIKRHTW